MRLLMNIPIVYEDDWLLVVNKPSGLLTIPTPKNESRTLTSILNEDLKDRGILHRLHPCHRLDRETSGLIIYAKGKSVSEKMVELFRQRQVKKRYVAFVSGQLSEAKGRISHPIEGASAVTMYEVIKAAGDFSVVKIMPLTGRTNQIRIHFKQIGHPLLGETKYAFRRDFKVKAKRLCLHSEALEFIHPVTQKKMSISCGLPKELEEFLKKHSV
jgi:23S rRNA pseudouridine1911/1915/1917 synthase